MYWNNPLINVTWPSPIDPVVASLHHGEHCLFWNPVAKFDNIKTNQTLKDLCNWANQWLENDGIRSFVNTVSNHYDIANLVKLNMWIADIRHQGIVKPWLILDQGNDEYIAGTGDSRLRCLERIPEIHSVPAFISTHRNRAALYQDLEEITTFDQFATLCRAEPGQEFLFRLTDPAAPFGMYWYEYNSDQTRSVTPGETEAVHMFINFYKKNPGVTITPEWFDHLVDWSEYRSV